MTRQVMVGEGTEAGMPAKLESLFCHNLLGLPSLSFIHFFSHKRNKVPTFPLFSPSFRLLFAKKNTTKYGLVLSVDEGPRYANLTFMPNLSPS